MYKPLTIHSKSGEPGKDWGRGCPAVAFWDIPTLRPRIALCWFHPMANAAASYGTVPIMPRTMSWTSSLAAPLLCAQVLFSFPDAAHAQQAEQIEWQDERSFTEADRNAIPALAKIMGLQNPKRVYQGEYLPDLCPYAMVESTYSESGHLRTYLQLTVHRKDWKCMRPAGTKSKRVGRWSAYTTELETRREWRIQEDRWVKYVPFGDGVSYEDAELIALAIKHHQLVNRLAGNVSPFQVQTIDPADITSIQVKANAVRTFEVGSSKGGSGEIYVIRLNDHSVELHEVRFWIA
jgi:hypothetical protein